MSNSISQIETELIEQAEQTWQETIASIEAFDGLIANVRHEMIIHRTRQFIAAETKAQPVLFPGALLDCQAAKLLALRSDVAAFEYPYILTSYAKVPIPPMPGIWFDLSEPDAIEKAQAMLREQWGRRS